MGTCVFADSYDQSMLNEEVNRTDVLKRHSLKLADALLVGALMKEPQARNKRAEARADKPSCARRMTISLSRRAGRLPRRLSRQLPQERGRGRLEGDRPVQDVQVLA
jgi:hypothetical protein